MFNVILPCVLHGATDLFRLLVGDDSGRASFSNFTPYLSDKFSSESGNVLICLMIAVFGTAFAFFLSMKAVSLVSPLVVSVHCA